MNKAVALLPALAFTEAPALMRTSMTATWLLEAALCNGVSPTLVFRPTCIAVMTRLQTALQLQNRCRYATLLLTMQSPVLSIFLPWGCVAVVRARH